MAISIDPVNVKSSYNQCRVGFRRFLVVGIIPDEEDMMQLHE